VWDEPGTYADPDAPTLHNRRSIEWNHGLGAVVSALVGADLRIEFLHEHDHTLFARWPFLARADDGTYRLPEGTPSLPLMHSVLASAGGGSRAAPWSPAAGSSAHRLIASVRRGRRAPLAAGHRRWARTPSSSASRDGSPVAPRFVGHALGRVEAQPSPVHTAPRHRRGACAALKLDALVSAQRDQ